MPNRFLTKNNLILAKITDSNPYKFAYFWLNSFRALHLMNNYYKNKKSNKNELKPGKKMHFQVRILKWISMDFENAFPRISKIVGNALELLVLHFQLSHEFPTILEMDF